MFCDELKLELIAGNGGNGCIGFRREAHVPKGGPDGGDGGNGGNIVLKVNRNLNTLSHLSFKKTYKADSGEHGMGKKMHGKNAEDLIIEVPKGTMVFNEDKSVLYADLSNEGEEIIIAKGGRGGLGNQHFATPTHQAPRFAEKGEPGERRTVIAELKLVADVGIIGLPSAGKSTLISVVSNARPKIAAYHFTTLEPNLGVVSMEKFGGTPYDNFVIEDIPGLIEGAHQGRGLGHKFLKHITRTNLVVHLIDGYLENADKNYKIIRTELKKFDKELFEKEEIVVLNKIDLLDEKTVEKRLKELKKVLKTKKVFLISGVTREGIKPLLFEIVKKLIKLKAAHKKELAAKTVKIIPILRPHLDKTKYILTKIEPLKDHKIFHISGKRIEQLISMTDLKNQEGLERIYHYFEKSGIKKEIDRKKATLGDYVRIKDRTIPYRP